MNEYKKYSLLDSASMGSAEPCVASASIIFLERFSRTNTLLTHIRRPFDATNVFLFGGMWALILLDFSVLGDAHGSGSTFRDEFDEFGGYEM